MDRAIGGIQHRDAVTTGAGGEIRRPPFVELAFWRLRVDNLATALHAGKIQPKRAAEILVELAGELGHVELDLREEEAGAEVVTLTADAADYLAELDRKAERRYVKDIEAVAKARYRDQGPL